MVTAFNCVNKWFKVNLLSTDGDKTHYNQFKTKNKPTLHINIVCNDNLITTPPKIKFLSIQTSRAHWASQGSLLGGSLAERTSSPVTPVLGLPIGDCVPWASERTRGCYVGKTVGLNN